VCWEMPHGNDNNFLIKNIRKIYFIFFKKSGTSEFLKKKKLWGSRKFEFPCVAITVIRDQDVYNRGGRAVGSRRGSSPRKLLSVCAVISARARAPHKESTFLLDLCTHFLFYLFSFLIYNFLTLIIHSIAKSSYIS